MAFIRCHSPPWATGSIQFCIEAVDTHISEVESLPDQKQRDCEQKKSRLYEIFGLRRYTGQKLPAQSTLPKYQPIGTDLTTAKPVRLNARRSRSFSNSGIQYAQPSALPLHLR